MFKNNLLNWPGGYTTAIIRHLSLECSIPWCVISTSTGSQKPCQTSHAADKRNAPEYPPLQMLPSNGPRARHANELLCSACRLRTTQPRIRVIAFAMNTSAYHILWCNASCNPSRGDCKTILEHQPSTLQSMYGNFEVS